MKKFGQLVKYTTLGFLSTLGIMLLGGGFATIFAFLIMVVLLEYYYYTKINPTASYLVGLVDSLIVGFIFAGLFQLYYIANTLRRFGTLSSIRELDTKTVLEMAFFFLGSCSIIWTVFYVVGSEIKGKK